MKNAIIKTITAIMGIIFVLAVCCIDSDPMTIPLIALIVSGAWLFLFAWANNYLV